ncbi:hypothetical protein [Halorubrum sp. F4]|uniref:hypothetical protein n=1 Tax=Halorubrum sp. F4 TaxID=2989715 RepID=UPI0024801E7A|nr:hypothetical protein [Halorubrum sp. F4]
MIRDTAVFLWTEAYAARRRLAALFVGFALLPGLLVVGTAGFDQTLPQDVPVGIAPAEAGTTADDLTVTRGGVALLGTPVQYDTEEAALRGLDREEVYLVVLVPPDVLDDEETTEFRMIWHGSAVPLVEAIGLLEAVLSVELSSFLPGEVDVTHEQRGTLLTLSEYLIPTGTTLFVLVVGLLFVPYDVITDRRVLDRIRHQSRLEAFVAAKLVFYTLLTGVVLAAVAVANVPMEYRIAPLRVETVTAVGLLFLSTAAVGIGIAFLLGLGRTTLFVNLGLLIGIVGLGSLLYPVGFFSSTRMEIARSLPPHYLAIVIRGHLVRGDGFGLYADWYRFIAIYVVGCLGFCWTCIRTYEWRR